MDFPTRMRIVLGAVAVFTALLASIALLNLMVLEPGTQDADDPGGGQPGSTGLPNQPEDPEQPGSEEPGEGDEPADAKKKNNPCKTGKSVMQSMSITTTVLALLLWTMAVWWRQTRQTRVMNGWAIAALVFTLMAVTMFFAWNIVNKICSLKVNELDSCRQIASNLLATFIAFLIPTLGFLAFAIYRKTQGHPFLGLWSGAGFVFLYLTIMSFSGWMIANDICDRYFEPPEPEFDPRDPDNPRDPGDPGQPPPGDPNQPSPPSNPPPGGGESPGRGGQQNSDGGGNPGGPSLVGVPQISPVALLVIMALAAVVVITVLAVRGGGPRFAMGGGQADDTFLVEDRGRLLAMLNRADLKSRDKVVAAYRAFVAYCQVRGVPKKRHETPYEHALRAMAELNLPRGDTLQLVAAYSQTRLGNEQPPASARQKAISFSRRMEGRK